MILLDYYNKQVGRMSASSSTNIEEFQNSADDSNTCIDSIEIHDDDSLNEVRSSSSYHARIVEYKPSNTYVLPPIAMVPNGLTGNLNSPASFNNSGEGWGEESFTQNESQSSIGADIPNKRVPTLDHSANQSITDRNTQSSFLPENLDISQIPKDSIIRNEMNYNMTQSTENAESSPISTRYSEKRELESTISQKFKPREISFASQICINTCEISPIPRNMSTGFSIPIVSDASNVENIPTNEKSEIQNSASSRNVTPFDQSLDSTPNDNAADSDTDSLSYQPLVIRTDSSDQSMLSYSYIVPDISCEVTVNLNAKVQERETSFSEKGIN